MTKLHNALLAVALLSAGAAANAGVITIDDFGFDQGPVSPQDVDDSTVNVPGIGDRRLRISDEGSRAPISNEAQVNSGILDITNGTGDDSRVRVRWDLAASLLPVGATNAFFSFVVVDSDANPTEASFTLGGVDLGTFEIPGNAGGQVVNVGPVDIASLMAGGEFEMELNGLPGWDLALDALQISFDDPSTVPVPGSLALLGLGLLGLSARRRV